MEEDTRREGERLEVAAMVVLRAPGGWLHSTMVEAHSKTEREGERIRHIRHQESMAYLG